MEGNRVVLEADRTISVTISLGCMHYPLIRDATALSFDECINLADVALCRAKAMGRNRSVQVEPVAPASYQEMLAEIASLSIREPRADDKVRLKVVGE